MYVSTHPSLRISNGHRKYTTNPNINKIFLEKNAKKYKVYSLWFTVDSSFDFFFVILTYTDIDRHI